MLDRPIELKQIVEEHAYVIIINKFINEYSRMEDVIKDIGWEISRNPHIGSELEKFPNFFIYRTNAIGEMPSFRVLYEYNPRINNNSVFLHDIEVVD